MNRSKKPLPTPDVGRSTLGESLRGSSQLAVTGVQAVTDIVESLHRQISGLALPVGAGRAGRTSGITGLVYGSVRGVTRWVGGALRVALPAAAPALEQLSPMLNKVGSKLDREAVLSALNGVLGDHLAATANPLAIQMGFRQGGKPLSLDSSTGSGRGSEPRRAKVLVLVHGLCMNDQQWLRNGHDHGAALAQDLGFEAVYLRYNTGRAVMDNGKDFSEQLERLVREWPVPIAELCLVVHSMGGLVSRSAFLHAAQHKFKWPKAVKSLVCLGTPHHGAPLERAGSWVDFLLGISPYSAPFARLGLVRSAGIQDLRHGRVDGVRPTATGKPPAAAPKVPMQRLPKHVRLFCVAATKQAKPTASGRLQGDGLVQVASALGRSTAVELDLSVPVKRCHVVFATDHFELLGSAPVYAQLRDWLV